MSILVGTNYGFDRSHFVAGEFLRRGRAIWQLARCDDSASTPRATDELDQLIDLDRDRPHSRAGKRDEAGALRRQPPMIRPRSLVLRGQSSLAIASTTIVRLARAMPLTK
ncbi:MAG: hypothetical protein ACKVS9_19275 [Phycisphaerae bacterium]